MMMFEQQSTWNPNMAYRVFEYIAKLYEGYVRVNNFNIYSSRLINIPAPKCIVFYNGKRNIPQETKVKLSDMYINHKQGDLEIIVTVYNINEGNESNKLKGCKPLQEYIHLVKNIKILSQNLALEEAINITIEDMPNDYLIKNLLSNEKAEVISMLQTEYDEIKYNEAIRDDVVRELAENLLKEKVSLDIISKTTKLSKKEIEKISNDLKNDKF